MDCKYSNQEFEPNSDFVLSLKIKLRKSDYQTKKQANN